MRSLFIVAVLIIPSACAAATSTPNASRPDEGATGTPTPETGADQPTASRQARREDNAAEDAMQTPAHDTAPMPTALTPQQEGRPAEGHPKLGSALNGLLAAYRQSGMPGAQSYAGTRGLVLDEGRVQVELVLGEGTSDEVIAQVESAGGEVQGHYGPRLQALLPLDALKPLAERPEVLVIRESRRTTP